tara:strand:- start:358 stop:912 length:555 start_codon:yes stop_codon:yes gene_type:complete
MTFEIPQLPTVEITETANVETAGAVANAILQLVVVETEVEKACTAEIVRFMKAYGAKVGLVKGKNKAGKGTPWAKVHSEVGKLLKDKHHRLRSDNAVSLRINRALNAAGFFARTRTVKVDTERKVIVAIMEHCAKREKGKIVDIDFDACIKYAGGAESPIAKAITKRFDEIAAKTFKLEVSETA